MELFAKQLIGFEASAEGGTRFSAHDPAKNVPILPEFPDATEGEVSRACKLASRAFPIFAALDRESRAAFMERIAAEIEALGDALLERANTETALPPARLVAERGRTCAQLRMFAALVREGSWVDARIDTAIPDRTPLPKPDLRRMLVPLGPVAVFGASNFPLAFSVAGGDTASAFAAGCPVVVKAHPAHPGTSELVGRAVQKAAQETGMPEGVFSMLQGGVEPGVALVRSPGITAVGFTGSLNAGRALFNAAADREVPIPVFAEMGSINPVFMLPGALRAGVESLAAGYVGSLTLGCGQFCTNPGVVIGVDSVEWQTFLTTTAKLLQTAVPATMLTPGICAAYEEGISRLRSLGAEEIVNPIPSDEPNQGVPHLFITHARAFMSEASLRHEVFGPSAIAVTCSNEEELKAVAASLDGQLTGTLHSGESDESLAGQVAVVLAQRVGRLIFNGYPTGVEVCPSMQHGGPYPATTDSRFTSVGTAAIFRFARPVSYQDAPDSMLPKELRQANPLGIHRMVNGVLSHEPA